jgi:hypothetical protein
MFAPQADALAVSTWMGDRHARTQIVAPTPVSRATQISWRGASTGSRAWHLGEKPSGNLRLGGF